jgi:hypothetical protein
MKYVRAWQISSSLRAGTTRQIGRDYVGLGCVQESGVIDIGKSCSEEQSPVCESGNEVRRLQRVVCVDGIP